MAVRILLDENVTLKLDVILSALGPYISDRYLAAKRQELEEYNRQVTPWELDRYISRY